jgi:hypothetical protein
MNRRGISLLAAAAGLGLVLLSVLADSLGVGGEPGFGWKQGIGVAVGGVLLVGAVAFLAIGRAPS